MSVNGRCRSCKAEIIWAKKADGKATPLEHCPRKLGNIRINKDGFAEVGQVGSGPYRSHYASCPDAEKWRTGRMPGQRPTRGLPRPRSSNDDEEGGHAA